MTRSKQETAALASSFDKVFEGHQTTLLNFIDAIQRLDDVVDLQKLGQGRLLIEQGCMLVRSAILRASERDSSSS